MPATENLESQLITEDAVDAVFDSYLNTDDSTPDTNDSAYLSLDIDGEDPTLTKVARTLEGPEACQFLGIPVRKHFHLQKGDYSRIARKFEGYLKHLRKQGNEALFWERIKVRVWKKANVDKITDQGFVGKLIPPSPWVKADEPTRYQGDVRDGNAISQYLAEYKHSTKRYQYILELLAVDVTEDMQHASPMVY